jgi:hypothetical protein
MGLDDACIHDVDLARIVAFANRTKTGEQIGYRRIYCSSQAEFADCFLV